MAMLVITRWYSCWVPNKMKLIQPRLEPKEALEADLESSGGRLQRTTIPGLYRISNTWGYTMGSMVISKKPPYFLAKSWFPVDWFNQPIHYEKEPPKRSKNDRSIKDHDSSRMLLFYRFWAYYIQFQPSASTKTTRLPQMTSLILWDDHQRISQVSIGFEQIPKH